MSSPQTERTRQIWWLVVVLALGVSPVAATPPAEPETIQLPAGSELRLLASPIAPVVTTVTEATTAEVLDRAAPWVRLRHGEVAGWWNPEASEAPGDPTPFDIEAPPLDPERSQAAALSLLGAEVRSLPLGPFRLLTDAGGDDLDALQKLVATLRDHYSERYGLDAPPDLEVDLPTPNRHAGGGDAPRVISEPGAGTVVLFADPATYRAFADDARLAGHTAGHLAALPLQHDPRLTRRLLAHEAGHLLNRNAFRGALPAWLDEGLAGDLELTPSTAAGRLLAGPLDRRAIRVAGDGRPYGPLVALDALLRDLRLGRLETLADLATLDTPTLLASPRRADLYALSALWVRFLLDERTPEGRHRAALFRAWLTRAATSPSPLPLPPELTTPATERAFRLWLPDLARRISPSPVLDP